MKNFLQKHKLEAGQVIPLIVFMIFVIIGFVALILDGGAIMSNRRTAQAAADAGALAGARRICGGYNAADAKLVAERFATEFNEATTATASVSGREVSVFASRQHGSFFAMIFDEETLNANAEAVAGCYYPSVANRVLPIAFYYKGPPVAGCDLDEDGNPVDGSCGIVQWPFEVDDDGNPGLLPQLEEIVDNGIVTGTTINLPLDYIYIVSDKTKICQKNVVGAIVCSEMSSSAGGGNRTFIDLSFLKGPPATLSRIIKEGLDKPLYTPAWVNGDPGTVSAVYSADNFTGFDPITGYDDLDARLYFVPVFDLFCLTNPKVNCYQDGPTINGELTFTAADVNYEDYLQKINNDSYRLIGFAPFVVTCVTMSDKCEFGECVPPGTYQVGAKEIEVKKATCPGFLLSNETQKNAIEGYFVNDIPADQYVWGTDGVDVGIYLVSLTK